MSAVLVYDDAMDGYRFGPGHPMRPERYTLAVDLARDWGILAEKPGHATAQVIGPRAARDEDLRLAHDDSLIETVKRAGAPGGEVVPGFGIGPGDTPAFPGMHQAAALIVGATMTATELVASGEHIRAFSPAGGLHHAHRDRSAGFCVYNDCVTAIARALESRPGMRIAYVDVDAHHGDGVEEAFYGSPNVLTVSIHESGRFLYPGTGTVNGIGEGRGHGYALSVPMLPGSDIECYRLALEHVVEPALAEFGPDLIFAQLGADTHRDDPLAHLDLGVRDQCEVAKRIIGLADTYCVGRIVATGGGGYDPYSSVPRFWAWVMSALTGVDPPEALPETWRARASDAATRAGVSGFVAPRMLFDEKSAPLDDEAHSNARAYTESVMKRLAEISPLLAG